MTVISVQHLTRDYGSGKGIFDLSIGVDRGEVFGFLGPNGSGKTTTIRHLMGFIRPQIGSCQIDGKNCWADREIIQRKLGYIPGEISFFDDMTGKEFLQFQLEYRKIKDDTKMREVIERFELDPRGRIKKMSKGMKQKLGIVSAFMHDPEILILDEPTCFFSDTKYSITVGAGIPALMYVLQMLANSGEKAEFINKMTFFTLFDPNGIVAGDSNATLGAIVLVVGAVLLYTLGVLVFCRKDLHI